MKSYSRVVSQIGVCLLFFCISTEAFAGAPAPNADRIVELNRTYNAFSDAIREKPKKRTANQLNALIRDIQKAAEAYFESAGISAIAEAEQQIQLAEELGRFPKLRAKTYRLTGTRDGDAFSRLLWAFSEETKHPGRAVKIVFDPLFELKGTGAIGSYSMKKTQLSIGPQAFTGAFAGYESVMYHELQHHIARLKLEHGEMTLASFEFYNAEGEKRGYRKFFALDELEAYLRDLRYLKRIGGRFDSELSDAAGSSGPSKIKGINDHRLSVFSETKEKLVELADRAKVIVKELETAFEQGRISSGYELNGFRAYDITLENSMYKTATVYFAKEPVNDKLKQEIQARIEYAFHRIQEIKSEAESTLPPDPTL